MLKRSLFSFREAQKKQGIYNCEESLQLHLDVL